MNVLKKVCVALALCLALSGCGRRHEFSIKEELRPATFKELVAMDREQLERVDIGRMNLLCANEASPDDDLDVEGLLGKLDEWADHCRRAEIRFRKSFEKNPTRYDDSYAKFKAVNLVLTIKEDFKCRYQMRLVHSGAMADINSPAFFKDYNDVFIAGLLRRRRGTCSSYPVLIAALGRRLGYPIFLKATRGHLLCEWDDGVERFNIDTNGNGVDTPPDEYYLKSPIGAMDGMSAADIEREYFMRPLGNWESLGMFIETTGYCHEANGRMDKAIEAYNLALRYLPNSENLKRLAARRVMPKELFDHVQEAMRMNEENRRRINDAGGGLSSSLPPRP